MKPEDAPPAYTSIADTSDTDASKPTIRTGNIAKVHILVMASWCIFFALLILYSDLSSHVFWAVLIPLIPLPALASGYYGIERKKILFLLPLVIFTTLFFIVSLLICVAGVPILFFGAIKSFKDSGVYNGIGFVLVALCVMLLWSAHFLKSTIDVTLTIKKGQNWRPVDV
ncbi:hypothetical protein PRIPAC_70039 [Pristionchus pacificus]|uniref:Uncharacterized protein n=1 Tax=Pristionchus pacificus TaxID=54126 RepID=A0A454XYY4_PRIPA|nr:hypothetical protein PRIPAC_70039 [Pristionchus pacificus]|eukprot:PDM74619.1 hypothetical protein PRIPAC_41975 [Pristionchus pacificus]